MSEEDGDWGKKQDRLFYIYCLFQSSAMWWESPTRPLGALYWLRCWETPWVRATLLESTIKTHHNQRSQSAVSMLTPSVSLSRHAGEGLDEQARLDGKRGGPDLHLQPGREHQAQEHRGEN